MELFLNEIEGVLILELFAALAGSFYLFRTKDTTFIRYFCWFLWLTVFVEYFGIYSSVAYYSDYKIFPFLKESRFAANYWMYNVYSIIAFSIYILLFVSQLENTKIKKAFRGITLLFVIACVLNLLFSGVYWNAHSIFTFFIGTILVLISIGFYYFQLLRTDQILNIRHSLFFYISVGALVYHLGFVPLVIYNGYFNLDSPEYLYFYGFIIKGINYFLYSLYIFGFLICSRKKKFY